MLSLQELRKVDLKVLHKELEEARIKKIKSTTGLKLRQDKESHKKQQSQKYIAQILTVMRELQNTHS